MAEWLATRYVIAARALADQAGDDGLDLPTLTKLTSDVVALRKGDHSAERLRFERERLELERERSELCADVVELRRGDHSAKRLELERARVAAAERDADMKWKRKIVIGLETLEQEIRKNPEAKAAFKTLSDLLRHPFEPAESE